MKFERITVGVGCVIRPSTTIMSGAILGNGSVIDANTLVMKNEFISPLTLVRGVPAKKAADIVQLSPNEVADEETASLLSKGDTMTEPLIRK